MKRRTAIASSITAGAVILAAGGVVTWGVLDHRSWDAEVAAYEVQTAEADDKVINTQTTALEGWTTGVEELNTAIDAGEGILAASEGQVNDNSVRQTLRDALDNAISMVSSEQGWVTEDLVVPAINHDSLFIHDSRQEYVVQVTVSTDPSPDQLSEALASVQEASAAVESAQNEWARQSLEEALASAENVYAESDGKVADDSVRVSLRETIDAARGVKDEESSSTGDLVSQRDAVQAATSSVSEAQSEWQAEQDRIAAEKAAAAKTKANQGSGKQQSSSSSSKGSTGSKGSSSSSSSGGSSSSSGSNSGSSGSAGSSGSGSGGGSGSGCLSCGGKYGDPASLPTALSAWGCSEADTLTYAPGKGWTKSSALADAKSRGCTGPFNFFGEWY